MKRSWISCSPNRVCNCVAGVLNLYVSTLRTTGEMFCWVTPLFNSQQHNNHGCLFHYCCKRTKTALTSNYCTHNLFSDSVCICKKTITSHKSKNNYNSAQQPSEVIINLSSFPTGRCFSLNMLSLLISLELFDWTLFCSTLLWWRRPSISAKPSIARLFQTTHAFMIRTFFWW